VFLFFAFFNNVVVKACASNFYFFCNVDCHFWGMMCYAPSLASLELQCSCIFFPYNFILGVVLFFFFSFFKKKNLFMILCVQVFFYLHGLHLCEALKLFSSFCYKNALKVSFFSFFSTLMDIMKQCSLRPSCCLLLDKQLANFLPLVFVYLFFLSMVFIVYNTNMFLVFAFFNNVDHHC